MVVLSSCQGLILRLVQQLRELRAITSSLVLGNLPRTREGPISSCRLPVSTRLIQDVATYCTHYGPPHSAVQLCYLIPGSYVHPFYTKGGSTLMLRKFVESSLCICRFYYQKNHSSGLHEWPEQQKTRPPESLLDMLYNKSFDRACPQ
jgi:hypothetical protein